MSIDDKYNDLLPEEICNLKIKLWPNQKNLISTSLYIENEYIKASYILENILKLSTEYYHTIKIFKKKLTKEKVDENDLKSSITQKLESYKRRICINDDVGQGKSYAVLCICFQKQSLNKKLNIIIVPFKLIQQWEMYINKLEISNYYVINTSKALNKFTLNPEDDFIVLLSDTFTKKFYDLYSYNIQSLRCFVDEYDFISTNKYYIESLLEKSIFQYVISSTIANNTEITMNLKNKERFINKREFPINNISIKVKSLKELFNKLSVDDIDILKNYDISNYDNSDELFKKIFESKQKKIISLKNELIRNLNYLGLENCTMESVLDLSKEIYHNIDKEKNDNKIYIIFKTNYDILINEIDNRNIIDRLILDECNICLNDNIKENKIVLLCCCNLICFDCYYKIKICPYCRKIQIKSNPTIENGIDSKIKKLINLKFNKKSKIIILGNTHIIKKENLEILSLKWFSNTNILTLNGNSSYVNKNLLKFKTSTDYNILYFSDLKSVCGLNLEFATDLILIGTIKKEEEIQIIGRVQRYGRVGPLNLYTFEEIV